MEADDPMTVAVPPADAPLGDIWEFALTWNGYEPEGDDERYMRALVARIGELGGGSVPGPPDPLL